MQAVSSVPRILRAIAEITGMRFSCIARVTEASWTVCAVYDAAGYGLVPGNELPIDTTFCKGVRETGQPIVFDSASTSEIYCGHPSPKLYGFESYASLPLYRANGDFFGTLCALDPLPANPSNPATLATLQFFAELISDQLLTEEQLHKNKLLHESITEQLRTTEQDRLAAEQSLIALKESEDRFRAAVSATGVMWTNDAKGTMTGEQPGWTGLTGQSLFEYEGYGWSTAIHPEDAAPTVAAWNAAVAERRTFEFEHRVCRFDGAWRTFAVKAVPVITQDGEVREWVGVHTDITERKQSEQALATKEARVRLATDVIGLGIWTWNPNNDSVQWENKRISEIFGVDDDFEPINAASFTSRYLHPDDVPLFQTAAQDVLSGNKKFYFQGRIYRANDNALRWVELHGEPYEIKPGIQGVLGTVSDITERKKGENALVELAAELQNADRHRSEFIATLAHELRSPLAPIRNGVQLLRMANQNPGTVARVSEVIDRQVGQMVRLIDDLLDVTRINRGQIELHREQIYLHEIIATAVETSLPFIEARFHDFKLDMDPTPIALLADGTRIAQVISNLLNNAAKYTPPYGKICLKAQQIDDDAVLTVTDSGIGIPPEALDRVFHMFDQIKEHRKKIQDGLGIGLALVQTLVQLHGGTVQVRSDGEDKGSRFIVRLPISELHSKENSLKSSAT